MSINLRPYQSQCQTDIENSDCRNILAVLPTGAGKTVLFAHILREHKGASCAIAHRQELVLQISIALAREQIRHKIIGPKDVVKLCVNVHMVELGRSYYDPTAQCAVAGVDTLIRRKDNLRHWSNSVSLWVQDEAHHLLHENKWGVAAGMFPNARGLGVTATPMRADGKGLGCNYDGVFEKLIVGPSMRELINMGYLTDYRIFAPASDIDLTNVTLSKATGDYNFRGLTRAVHRSHIVGDVVKEYLKIAPGKLGVTFATDVLTATNIAEQFNSNDVPAAVVSAKTSNAERVAVIRKFKNKEILQLVNVDLFGEGFDLPAIEVVSMARPTKSYGLYVQQFGRALRLMIPDKYYSFWDQLTDTQRKEHISNSDKPVALIIDHVNNVDNSRGGHGLPDAPKQWSLERRHRKSRSKIGEILVRTCPQCAAVYERTFPCCPYCAFRVRPTQRSLPEHVDGDLTELDPSKLAEMRGEIEKVTKTTEEYRTELANKNVPLIGQLANVKRHSERLEALEALKHSIAWWAGYQRALGRRDPESYRRFYFAFGIDVLSAQMLKKNEALQLAEKINSHLVQGGIQ